MLLVDQGWFDTRPDVVGLIGDPLIPVATRAAAPATTAAAAGQVLELQEAEWSRNSFRSNTKNADNTNPANQPDADGTDKTSSPPVNTAPSEPTSPSSRVPDTSTAADAEQPATSVQLITEPDQATHRCCPKENSR